jgi:hypothetical protein
MAIKTYFQIKLAWILQKEFGFIALIHLQRPLGGRTAVIFDGHNGSEGGIKPNAGKNIIEGASYFNRRSPKAFR